MSSFSAKPEVKIRSTERRKKNYCNKSKFRLLDLAGAGWPPSIWKSFPTRIKLLRGTFSRVQESDLKGFTINCSQLDCETRKTLNYLNAMSTLSTHQLPCTAEDLKSKVFSSQPRNRNLYKSAENNFTASKLLQSLVVMYWAFNLIKSETTKISRLFDFMKEQRALFIPL